MLMQKMVKQNGMVCHWKEQMDKNSKTKRVLLGE
jgi:hypothetical protein